MNHRLYPEYESQRLEKGILISEAYVSDLFASALTNIVCNARVRNLIKVVGVLITHLKHPHVML